MATAPNPAVTAALAEFAPSFAKLKWNRVSGGLSGAMVFAGVDSSPRFALKLFPKQSANRVHLEAVHRAIIAAQPTHLVPELVSSRSGVSLVELPAYFCEMATWVPGEPNRDDSQLRLQNACKALAELHEVWRQFDSGVAPFPAVARRLRILREWRTNYKVTHSPRVNDAERVLPAWIDWAERTLAPLEGNLVDVHPCLCDVHREHVLFHPFRSTVSGFIDFTAMKCDHPSVDLARYIGNDANALQVGLNAYREAGGVPTVTADIITILDRTGTVVAVAYWLLRTQNDGELPPAGEVRLRRAVGILQMQSHPHLFA